MYIIIIKKRRHSMKRKIGSVLGLLIAMQFFTGKVYPVHSNKFYIGVEGLNSTDGDMVIIRGLENFAPAIDSKVETWEDMTEEGWASALATGKSITVGFSGKRQYGDPGNDFVGETMLATGDLAESKFIWELPSGSVLKFDCVITVSKPGGGDTTGADSFEFEVKSNKKPTFIPVSGKLITISAQPQNAAVVVGSVSGALSVTGAIEPSGSIVYQWFTAGAADGSGEAVIAGANSSSYTIPTDMDAGAHYFFCRLAATGADTVTTRVATVTASAS
jgi:hypothetical protein